MSRWPHVDAAAARSGLVRKAVSAAHRAYRGAYRDASEQIPFLDHALAVGDLLAEREFTGATVAAGILHDVLEYTDADEGDVRDYFDEEVSDIVAAVSEEFEIEDEDDRRQELRERVAASDPAVHQVFAADKIANVIAVREAYEVWGEDVEEEMERELDEQIRLWEDDLEMLFEIEEDVRLFDRLAEELLALWQLRVSSESDP